MTAIEVLKHALLLLIALQIKHVICDGPLQTLQMVRDKSSYGKPLGIGHALIHSVGSLVVFIIIGVPLGYAAQLVLLEFVLHYHIDFIKEKLVQRKGWYHSDGPFWWALIADQTLHHMTYAMLVWLVFKP
jgi:ABC-type phosphate transport system permease subunit